jgi:hypothetical protein
VAPLFGPAVAGAPLFGLPAAAPASAAPAPAPIAFPMPGVAAAATTTTMAAPIGWQSKVSELPAAHQQTMLQLLAAMREHARQADAIARHNFAPNAAPATPATPATAAPPPPSDHARVAQDAVAMATKLARLSKVVAADRDYAGSVKEQVGKEIRNAEAALYIVRRHRSSATSTATSSAIAAAAVPVPVPSATASRLTSQYFQEVVYGAEQRVAEYQRRLEEAEKCVAGLDAAVLAGLGAGGPSLAVRAVPGRLGPGGPAQPRHRQPPRSPALIPPHSSKVRPSCHTRPDQSEGLCAGYGANRVFSFLDSSLFPDISTRAGWRVLSSRLSWPFT